MADGKVVIETDLDASGIKAGLSKLTGIAQSGIKGTLTAIASAGTALAGLGGAAIKIGADFEEGMSEVQAGAFERKSQRNGRRNKIQRNRVRSSV